MIDCKKASVSEIQRALWDWQHRNFPQYSDNNSNLYEDLKFGVIEEMGELFHAVLKRKQGIRGTKAEHDAAIRDAIGDMLVYTSQLMSNNGEVLTLHGVTLTSGTLIAHAVSLCAALESEEVDRVVYDIEFLALIVEVNSEMCFREAAKQVLARDWIAYPKTGKPEAGEDSDA